jgi:hypothetical protein
VPVRKDDCYERGEKLEGRRSPKLFRFTASCPFIKTITGGDHHDCPMITRYDGKNQKNPLGGGTIRFKDSHLSFQDVLQCTFKFSGRVL